MMRTRQERRSAMMKKIGVALVGMQVGVLVAAGWAARPGQAMTGLGQGDFPLTTAGTCTNLPTRTCTAATASLCPGGACTLQQSNLGGGVPPVPEPTFVGSLTCIEFTPGASVPDTSNTLI